MDSKKKSAKSIGVLVVLAVFVFGIIYGGITLTKNLGKSSEEVSSDKAIKSISSITDEIVINNVTARKEPLDLSEYTLQDSLPEIDKYPAQVNNTTDLYVEIFSSVEKTGAGTDGWLVDVANNFNKAGITVNGAPVSVRVRGLSSGLGMDYIASGKYTPDAYTPSNELWGEMLKAKGIQIELSDNRMVGNVAGIVLSKSKNDEIIKKYGSVNLKNITEAVANEEISMGYTNPFASATGLNFLASTLGTFDSKNPLSDTAVQGFEKFQNNIPLVSYTTIQMRSSAESGVLDGFIMEYQTFVNSPDLKSNYVFTPFGVRHDSPLYAIGSLSAEKKEVLNKFIEFYSSEANQKKAKDVGFNNYDDYKSEASIYDGATIIQAQKLWKEKKSGNKDIAAVFVADVSGSMRGEPLNSLKKSLINGSQYIGQNNSIGLVTYSDEVNINLPIGKFDINQRSLFMGAVKDMEANGGTATFDGIAVAVKMLMEEKEKNPDAKLMLFVLSDGETNRGHSLDEIEWIIRDLKIPVYTIGYNADISALQTISNINEAASINADSEDVVYELGNLFNAEM